MVVAEIRHAVEEKFAEGTWVEPLLQALTERGIKNAMKTVMWANSVPYADQYRANVRARIRVKQGISRLYRNDYWLPFDEWDQRLSELKNKLRVLLTERNNLRSKFTAVEFADLRLFDRLVDPDEEEDRKPKIKHGKCKKRKMKREQRKVQYANV